MGSLVVPAWSCREGGIGCVLVANFLAQRVRVVDDVHVADAGAARIEREHIHAGEGHLAAVVQSPVVAEIGSDPHGAAVVWLGGHEQIQHGDHAAAGGLGQLLEKVARAHWRVSAFHIVGRQNKLLPYLHHVAFGRVCARGILKKGGGQHGGHSLGWISYLGQAVQVS